MIGMCPNIRLFQLTLFSSTHCLIKPKPSADLNSGEGPGMSTGSVKNLSDSGLIASAGACCPCIRSLLPPGPCVFQSVLMSPDVRRLCVRAHSLTTLEKSAVGRYEYFNDPHS